MDRKQLFVTDLDGTLFGADGEISPAAADRLEKLLADGLPLSLASARSVVTMTEGLRKVEFALPVISAEGAFISDLSGQRRIVCNALDTETAGRLTSLAYSLSLPPYLYTYDGHNELLHCPEPVNEGMAWRNRDRRERGDRRYRHAGTPQAGLDQQVVCLTLIERRESLLPIVEQLRADFDGQLHLQCIENLYHRGWWWLTIHHARANKADALQQLADHLGVAMDNVTVFGDGANDLAMFGRAGRAVAVENADENVKAAADEIIGPNTADAVIDYLETRAG